MDNETKQKSVIVKFDDGTRVRFHGTPTLADIEEMAMKLGLHNYKEDFADLPETEGMFEEDLGIGQKVARGALDLTGGRELARGAGLGLAAIGTAKETEETQATARQQMDVILDRIKQARAEGRDTSRLMKQLERATELGGFGADVLGGLVEQAPSTKQVLGSAAQLATTAVAPSLFKAENPAL